METMIALLISSFLSLPFFAVTATCQRWSSHLALILERDANFWISPLLLARWTIPAGNNRWGQGWEGICVQPERFAIQSDIDGPDGFPDHELSANFEELVLRNVDSNLQVKSGSGSFQPLIKNISQFQANHSPGDVVAVKLRAVLDRLPAPMKEHSSDSIEFHFFLRNYRQNLFAEEAQ